MGIRPNKKQILLYFSQKIHFANEIFLWPGLPFTVPVFFIILLGHEKN
jgi:hypothetical protein